MKKQAENFVDYVPRHNKLFETRENDKGMIEVRVENKGLFNKIAQIFFKKPRYSYIELQGMGSFIWKQMDGTRTVYEIGQLVKNEYGKDAEPLYERLCTYVKSLHNMHFIVYVNKLPDQK